MTDRVLATASVLEDGGSFFYSLDDGASRVGPYDSQEAATEAATAFLTETYTRFVQEALFGDQK